MVIFRPALRGYESGRESGIHLSSEPLSAFTAQRLGERCRRGICNLPREALAKELRICEQRVTAAFRKLAELQLIWEKRCGRGDANQIYLASVTPIDDPNYECAPFCSESYESCGSRTADAAFLDAEEPQELPPQNPGIPAFRTEDPDVPEPQDLGASNTDLSQPDIAFSDVSPSVPSEDRPADDEKELTGILDACELSYFEPEVARVFENAIERLFYSDNLRIGQAVLPRSRVRSRLHLLNNFVLQEAEVNLHANRNAPVRDSTKYVMSTIYNCITETESNLMVDPYLNSLRTPPGKGRG